MQIAIATFPELTSLDAVGPYQVFSYLPGSEIVICAARSGVIADDHNVLQLDVTHTFADVPRPDIVVIPGGQITYRMIRDGDPIIDWIREVHPRTTYTTSVCNGALLLGAAGILTGLHATTHWSAYDTLATFGATPTEQRVVTQGRVMTAAGVSSGIDLALTLVGRIAGDDVARAIQLGIEYDPQPPYDSGAPSKATPEIKDLVLAMLDTQRDEIMRRP